MIHVRGMLFPKDCQHSLCDMSRTASDTSRHHMHFSCTPAIFSSQGNPFAVLAFHGLRSYVAEALQAKAENICDSAVLSLRSWVAEEFVQLIGAGLLPTLVAEPALKRVRLV